MCQGVFPGTPIDFLQWNVSISRSLSAVVSMMWHEISLCVGNVSVMKMISPKGTRILPAHIDMVLMELELMSTCIGKFVCLQRKTKSKLLNWEEEWNTMLVFNAEYNGEDFECRKCTMTRQGGDTIFWIWDETSSGATGSMEKWICVLRTWRGLSHTAGLVTLRAHFYGCAR